MARKKLPYSTGRRGINRVRVYRRGDRNTIWVAWRPAGWPHRYPKREPLLSPLTHTSVTDAETAIRIADLMAARLLEERNARVLAEFFGGIQKHTLGELLHEMHKARAGDWSDRYKASQDRFRDFWLRNIRPSTELVAVNAALVESLLAKASSSNGWSPRTTESYGRYLVDAFFFAQHKLKWIDEQHNLSAVKLPKPNGKGEPYELEELVRILGILPTIDLRAAGIGEVQFYSGRRVTSVRMLRTDSFALRPIRLGDEVREFGVIQFPASTDKARRHGEVVLGQHATLVMLRLLEMPAVQASGLFFPAGDLHRASPRVRDPVSLDTIIKEWWREAERRAGVPYVKGRATHGIKRTWATHVDVFKAARQAGTDPDTLYRIYQNDLLQPKAEVVSELERKRTAILGTSIGTIGSPVAIA